MAKRPIPWRRVLAEGTAIVVSILLAFGIQAGWEDRQAESEEERALLVLSRDFRENRDTLVLLVAEHRRWAASLAAFYGTPVAELRVLPADSVLDAVMEAFILQITYDPSVGGLETIVRGGRVDRLSDVDLESALWRWQRQLADSQEEAALLLATVNGTIREATALGLMDTRSSPPSDEESLELIWNSDALTAQAQVLDLWRRSYVDELESLLALTDSVLRLLPSAGR